MIEENEVFQGLLGREICSVCLMDSKAMITLRMDGLTYCVICAMIEQPDYLAYGIESLLRNQNDTNEGAVRIMLFRACLSRLPEDCSRLKRELPSNYSRFTEMARADNAKNK